MQKHVGLQNIVCDHCHYVEPVLEITPDLVGMRCPVCDEEMLSIADYKAWRRLMFWRRVQVALAWLFCDHRNFSVHTIDGSIVWRQVDE
ncbi:hypothetical protein [Mesorhizobium sp.]|uniref:hypothetical protein n=1 Tax=Mesorhizobium sp. TaxID=1871066 RepID=UPI000FE5D9E8|nr:hypothetical protein [Mesorhizobium sp.]RWI35497.1 MAG: hypothetical protein EOR14_28760 [Mesorhizobium sp.]RWJ66334.1 MAG: hypothetical protein EOR34_28375 [Mesorhizobium sp.]